MLTASLIADGLRAKVNCYGADDVREGVAIMLERGCRRIYHW